MLRCLKRSTWRTDAKGGGGQLGRATIELWLPLEGAPVVLFCELVLFVSLGWSPKCSFNPGLLLLEQLWLSTLKTSRHLFAFYFCFLWVTSGNFSKTSNNFHCVQYKLKQCFTALCITNAQHRAEYPVCAKKMSKLMMFIQVTPLP